MNKKNQKRFLSNGRYLISGTPHAGSIASVFRAYDTHEERHIALKIFRAIDGSDPVIKESFRRETLALSDLKHNHIVKILDSGSDTETSEHFIAMEWVENNLEKLLQNDSYDSWDSFFSKIGRDILEALAFAHSRGTVHRDIKPSNILITKEGMAKICDFGISKIRNFLTPGVTLAQFASFPYAPPELDDGSYSYSRDVFGFAVLSIAALTKNPIQNHKDLVVYLEQLKIDEPLKRLLRRAISLENPGERQTNAAVLLAEIDRLVPPAPIQKKGKILLSLTKKVKDIINNDIALKSDSEIQSFIENDLKNSAYIHEQGEPKPRPDGSPALGRTIRLIGSRYGYIAVMADAEKLLLVSALEQSSSEVERKRDRACPATYDFCFTGVLPITSRGHIEKLQDELLQFAADQKVILVQQRHQEIYTTWINLLHAKTELERQRKRRFDYTEFKVSGNAIHFTVSLGQEMNSLDGQDIQIDTATNDFFSGSVVSVTESVVVVQISEYNRVELSSLPKKGTIIVDTSKADVSLDRQKKAVDSVRFGRSVNPLLSDYIVEPSIVPIPAPASINFIQKNMDENKRDAVCTALSEPALMLVQGPPGTGKTTFITEVVLQTLIKNPNARILLTSQTHVALDNSLERILKESQQQVRALRIGHENDQRIAETMKAFLIDQKLPIMRKEALAKGKEFIENWAQKSGVNLNNTRMAMALENHARLQERLEEIEEELNRILSKDKKSLEAEERADLEESQSELVKERSVLEKDMKESWGVLRKHESDKEIIDHLTECSSEELRSWANSYVKESNQVNQLRKMLDIYSNWEIRFGRGRQFKAALITQSQVVAGTCLGVMSVPGKYDITYDLCIVDEASIATPTEVFVPMARARRTILVGDDKQLSPFQDPELKSSGLLERFSLNQKDQKETLFNHLRDGLPDQLRKELTIQYRMLPPIGKLISDCFYNSKLQSVERTPLGILDRTIPRPVTWFSTSQCAGKGSKKVGTSQFNGLEIKYISELLGRIDFELRHGKGKGTKISVAVLTGYGVQRARLNEAIQNKRHEWNSFSNIYINVVDAFQGREADVVIFSVTRSDARGLGFLREMERINVALSRGKEYLIIVGDHEFCQNVEGQPNPLKEVIKYICGNPQDCALEEIKHDY